MKLSDGWWWSLVGCLLLAGCDERDQAPPQRPPAPAPSASTAKAGKARAAPASVPTAQAASAPTPAPAAASCKALAKGKLVAIGSHPGIATALAIHSGSAYLLMFHERRARIEVVRMPRDGSESKSFGSYTANVRPDGLVVGDHAAYYGVHGKLLRQAFDTSAPKLIAEGLSGLALNDDHLYGVRCPAPGSRELIRVPEKGGSPTVLASFAGPKSRKCNISHLALEGTSAFLSEWGARRVLRIDLDDGKLLELAAKKPFPKRIAVGNTHVVFQSANGLESVPKNGGKVERLTEIGSSPFHHVAWDQQDFFILNEDAYGPRAVVERMPRTGGKREELAWFQVKEVTEGSGLTDIAVDDQCFYLTRQRGEYSELLAQPKGSNGR